MSLSPKVYLLSTSFILVSVFYCPFAHADTDTKKLIGGYGSSVPALNALTAPPADPLVAPQGNAQALYTRTANNPEGTSKTQQNLAAYFALNPNATGTDDVIANIVNSILTFGDAKTAPPSSASLYASCAKGMITGGGSGLSGCLLEKQAPPFANVDLNSLIGPLVYASGQEKIADNFISASAGLANPFTPVDLKKLAAKANTTIPVLIATNQDVAKYIAMIRSYAAAQAIALSNLNQLYAERLPSKVDPNSNNPADKNLAIALAAINLPNASQLQVENYMATRRITDPQWVSNLAKDSPAALLRQIVILLAENLAESYNNRLASERIIATLSVMDLQQLGIARATFIDRSVNELNKPQTSGR